MFKINLRQVFAPEGSKAPSREVVWSAKALPRDLGSLCSWENVITDIAA